MKAGNKKRNVQVDLRPSLWRTARAVANADRLRLLRIVADGGGNLGVSEIAAESGLPLPIASLYLRALNARGLLGVDRREGRVFYSLTPDRSLPVAASVQSACKTLFRTGGLPDDWAESLVAGIRAFSHFRRLDMMNALLRSPSLDPAGLRAAVGIPPSSFQHHLAVLERSGLVRRSDDDGLSLVSPFHPVLRALFQSLARCAP